MRAARCARVRRLVLLVVLAACGVPSTQTAAPAPLLDTAGGSDAADRDCNVVLRQMLRAGDGGGSGSFQTDGASWVFVAEVEISEAAAAQGLTPALLYTSGADATWYAASGTEAPDGATPGFVKYEITLDHGVPGPSTGTGMSAIPYLPLAGGGRRFDHNRYPADLASYALDASDDFSIWAAPAVCAAPTDARGATIAFTRDWKQSVAGVIVPGGQLTIDYDPARLTACRGAGADVTAHVAFAPDGETYAASVAAAPATFTIPTDGARQVAIWFEATDATSCTAWDSAYGANYTFAVETPPAWMGLATNLLTRDPSSHCGGADAAQGFTFDTWTRNQADITNLCFQAYQPGETDTDGGALWQELDAELHWRLVSGAASTPWATTPIGYDARVGNNAQYALSWRDVDPFRPYHCPELAAQPTPDGQYVQIGIEYYVDVNGGQLRPEPGAAYAGTFVDYPSNPWRASNCP
jgi:hypothetical protein